MDTIEDQVGIGKYLDGMEEEVIIREDGSFGGRYCAPIRVRIDANPKYVTVEVSETRYVIEVMGRIKSRVAGILETTNAGLKFCPIELSNSTAE